MYNIVKCFVNEIVKAFRFDTNKHLTCSCVCRGLCLILQSSCWTNG